MTTSYSPRPDSIADRAHRALSAQGELSGAALADAIDLDDWRTLRPSLTVAVDHGYIKRILREGLNYYSVGDGVPVSRTVVDADDIDDDPPVQRVVPANAAPVPTPLPKAKPKTEAAALNAKIVVPENLPRGVLKQPSASARMHAAAPAEEPVFGVYTDGRLVIEQGQEVVTISAAAADKLLGLLMANAA